jgi:ELWxxDGT repeat protein
MTYKFNKLRYISPLVALAILSGCSNSSTPTDATSTEKTAYLIDSAIEGIDFTCGTITGTTDSEGKFTYDTTKCPTGVEFKLGSLSLGTINPSAINTDTYLTIQELAGTTRDNVTDGNVTKLAVLLQSLDDDNDPTNGIYITQTIKNAITLDGNISAKTDSELSAEISARGKTEKDVNVALAHLLETTRAKDSSVAPITITPRDFNLTSVTDTELGTQTTSNTITIAGLTIPTYITISNGEYSINGGEWKSTKSLVKNDDNLTVRHTTADTVSATTTTTLKIGGMTKTFGTTTTPLTQVQRSYFFTATDGTNGYELWKSDGTADGTVMVKDIVADYGSYPSNFTVLGDKLYFNVSAGLMKMDYGLVMVQKMELQS